MLIVLILCVFSGAVKLRLEQEGEAQLRSQRCGLYAQVQPGEAPYTVFTSHLALP